MILLGMYRITDTNYGLYKGKYCAEFSICQNRNDHFKGKTNTCFWLYKRTVILVECPFKCFRMSELRDICSDEKLEISES